MKINYDIDATQSIINTIGEKIQEIETLDKKYLSELDALQSVYQSPSGMAFFEKIVSEYANYTLAFSSFCQALTALINVQAIHAEAQGCIYEEINKLGG